MKIRKFGLINILVAILILVTVSFGGTEAVFALTASPQSITSTFGKEAETMHNFTWTTSKDINSGVIEYCAKDEFAGFGQKNIQTEVASSYGTNTDTDARMIHKVELMNFPIVPTLGNHDVMNSNNTNTNAKNFTDSFNLPKEINTGAPSGTVYSFDYGNTHIAVMNTECGTMNLKEQADWLRRDMAGSTKLWKIVALHRGPYGATYDESIIRNAWAPVFYELGIDLVLQGHDHNYVRSYMMKSGAEVKNGIGTLYITGNTGGVKFYPLRWRIWQKVDLQPRTQMYIA